MGQFFCSKIDTGPGKEGPATEMYITIRRGLTVATREYSFWELATLGEFGSEELIWRLRPGPEDMTEKTEP